MGLSCSSRLTAPCVCEPGACPHPPALLRSLSQPTSVLGTSSWVDQAGFLGRSTLTLHSLDN